MERPLTHTVVLHLSGMRAVHCARAVYTSLAGVPGIVTADVVVGRATVEHDGRASEAALREAVAQAGYEVERIEKVGRTLKVL